VPGERLRQDLALSADQLDEPLLPHLLSEPGRALDIRQQKRQRPSSSHPLLRNWSDTVATSEPHRGRNPGEVDRPGDLARLGLSTAAEN
jgi:hypothetical protein